MMFGNASLLKLAALVAISIEVGVWQVQWKCGDAEAETAFAAGDFVTKPLYFGRPWFLPMVYFWYGMKDRMGM